MDIAARIRDAIGEEPVAAFGRRCGIGESLLRKYLAGSEPSATNLAKIADAAGVTVDWLATGRGPKRRIEANKELQNQRDSADLDTLAGDAIEEWRAILKLLGELPERESAALRRDLFARAQNAAELVELRRAVAEIRAASQKKTA